MNQEDNLKGRWNRMKEYLNLGITLVIGLILLLAKDRMASAFSMENFPVTLLSTLLLFETLFLISNWIRASVGELQMFRDYFEDFVPVIPSSTFFFAVSIAIFLVVLAYFSYDIVIYSSIFACFQLFGVWGGRIRASEVRSVLKRARGETPQEDERRTKWDTIENYEFEISHMLRAVTGLFFCFVPLILGLLGESSSQTSKIWLLSTAYIIMILNIAISEIVIIRWRRKRDDALGDSYF